jgi:hypothetical protein
MLGVAVFVGVNMGKGVAVSLGVAVAVSVGGGGVKVWVEGEFVSVLTLLTGTAVASTWLQALVKMIMKNIMDDKVFFILLIIKSIIHATLIVSG